MAFICLLTRAWSLRLVYKVFPIYLPLLILKPHNPTPTIYSLWEVPSLSPSKMYLLFFAPGLCSPCPLTWNDSSLPIQIIFTFKTHPKYHLLLKHSPRCLPIVTSFLLDSQRKCWRIPRLLQSIYFISSDSEAPTVITRYINNHISLRTVLCVYHPQEKLIQ